ncbi:hypothetical protein AGMMS49965_04520 [Bacteroidia bacterium]|nr:hypothetical protein AGMMS49965_04520 [Bacteroidia bacterium]
MPTIFIFFGLRFMFYSDDHEPIHIHVVKGKGRIKEKAKFQVVPEVVLIENNGLSVSELKVAEGLIEENKQIIVDRWNKFFSAK